MQNKLRLTKFMYLTLALKSNRKNSEERMFYQDQPKHKLLPYEFLEQHPIVIRLSIVGLALAIVLLDYLLPLGVAAGTPYGLVVVATIAAPSRLDTYMAACACIALTVIGFYISPPTIAMMDVVITNRLLAIAIIIGALVMVLQRRKYVEQVDFLTQLSVTDSLTGISNRYAFEKRIRSEVRRADRYQLALTLAIIDIDHFKLVNDTQGHDEGDRLLTSTAKLVNTHIRDSDYFFRLGGDEFAVIFTNTDAESAFNALEHIRCLIEEQAKQEPHPYSLSIGVASLKSDEDHERLFKHADIALYKAKEGGRNQTAIYRE
jgi:diguanylate cyclase (GGDEF)-like protein